MKKWASIVVFLFFTVNARADTLIYLKVYYNKLELGHFDLSGGNKMKLKRNVIRDSDSLIVYCFRDKAFPDYLIHGTFENEENRIVAKSEKKSTQTPTRHSFSLKDLSDSSPEKGFTLEFFYWEDKLERSTQKQMLFTFRIE